MTIRRPFELRLERLGAAGAFTLIEIMIVMAIVAIILSMGVPSMMRAMEKDDLARAVRDVIEGCKTARDRRFFREFRGYSS